MNTGQSDAAPSLLSRVEQLIKLAASLAAVAAATGLPAVYIQYSNLGIPNSFITSEQILRAGIAPGSLFLFVGAYVLLLIQEYENGRAGLGAFMGPGIMFVPVPVFAIIVLYVGLFALGVWVWWVVLYPLFWLIGTERVRQVHFWVANGAAFLNLVPPLAGAYIWPFVAPYVLQFVAFLVILQRTPRWVVPILSAVARIANETTLDQKETKPANKSESEGPPVVPSPMEEQERKEVSKFRIFAWITAGFAVFLPAGTLRNSLVPAATRDVTRSAGRNEFRSCCSQVSGRWGWPLFSSLSVAWNI